MKKITLIISNNSTDYKEVVLFGDKVATTKEGIAIDTVGDINIDQMNEAWGQLGTVVEFGAKMVCVRNNAKPDVQFIGKSEANHCLVQFVIASLRGENAFTKSGGMLFRTDKSTCIYFGLFAGLTIEIQISLQPSKQSNPQ